MASKYWRYSFRRLCLVGMSFSSWIRSMFHLNAMGACLLSAMIVFGYHDLAFRSSTVR
ncbi:hypothetical protein [Dubosiella newyorkensis]|uniref:hypothetical protein n=1 Tax=Dubosiella newyorkensis TaxID=1862672 RepID=UPI003F673218